MGGAMPGLNQVQLGMMISAEDDGFSGVIEASIEQVNALKETWQSLAEVEDPFNVWTAQMEGMVASVTEQVNVLKATMAQLSTTEKLTITIDDAAALAALDQLKTQATSEMQALEGTFATGFSGIDAQAQTAFAAVESEAAAAMAATEQSVQGAAAAVDESLKSVNDGGAFVQVESDAQAAASAMQESIQNGASTAAESLQQISNAASQVESSAQGDFQQMAQGLEQSIQGAVASAEQSLQGLQAELSAIATEEQRLGAGPGGGGGGLGSGLGIAGAGTTPGGGVLPPVSTSPHSAVANAIASGAMTAEEAVSGGLITAEQAAAMGFPLKAAATAAETGAAASGGLGLGGLGAAAGIGIMGSMAAGMLATSSMGAVDLEMLLQQNPGMTPPQGMQLLADFGTVGLGPNQARTALDSLESGLKSDYTLTGSSGFSKDILLAMSEAGLSNMVKPGESAQNILGGLQNLGIQPQLGVMADLYQNMVHSGGANMGDIQTLFGGMGAGGQNLQMLLANYGQIDSANANVGAGLTATDVKQMSSQSLSMAENMSQLSLQFMEMANSAAPELEAAFKALTEILKPITGAVKVLNELGDAGANVTNLLETISGARSGIDQFTGALEEAIGHLINIIPGHRALFGNAGNDLIQAGAHNLAEAEFIKRMTSQYGAAALAGPHSTYGTSGPNSVSITVNIPSSAGAGEQSYAEEVAREIVAQLKLSGNVDLTS